MWLNISECFNFPCALCDIDLSSDETPVRTSENDAGIPDVTTIRGVTQHIHYTTPSGGSPVIVPPYTPVTAPPTPTGSWPITSHTHHDVTSTHPLDQSWGIEVNSHGVLR